MASRRAADLADLRPLHALGNPIRRRLYELVADAGRAITRAEAATAAGVSRSLAAYHLDKLVERGMLEASFSRRGEGRGPGAGRPAKAYQRAQREFVLRAPPRDYRLLGELLACAAEDDESGAVRAALERVAHEVGTDLGRAAKQEQVIGRDDLEEVLRQRGYEPFLDRQGTLRLRNCPFEPVARQCPEVVCALNLRLLKGVIKGFGASGVQPMLEPAEGNCCVTIARE